MAGQIPSGPDFETRLQREVDRILADPAFERSPVQSKLLQYLCEQTVARNRNISQMAVAVDGLGRPETVEQLTESYPRVQISRLRRNLALYYARLAPGEGLAVYIRHGDYQLRLATPESAYPKRRPRPEPRFAANDGAVPPASAPPPPSPPVATESPPWFRQAAVAASMVAMAALAGVWFAGTTPPTAPALDIELGRTEAGATSNSLLLLAAQQAGDVADNSYVVRNVRADESHARPDYVVKLERSQSLGAMPILNIALFDRANQRLFRDAIPLGDDRSAILTRLNGSMMHIVGPAGLIAQRELAQIGGKPRNDYQCVLQTESDRLLGYVGTDRVEACLDRFPNSEYRAYWLTRLAFMAYRSDAIAGNPVNVSGAAWQNLQRAFAADPTNPFANYLAAKIDFVRGDCAGGRPYMERTLANGSFHGTMMAAALADASLCEGSGVVRADAERRVEGLVNGIPEPNPLQHVYLIFASAAVDRPDLVQRLLATPTSEIAQGPLAEVTSALDDALAGPAQFEANRTRLQKVIDTFYWGPNARRSLMEKLDAVAKLRGGEPGLATAAR
jgi:hypothetical protein